MHCVCVFVCICTFVWKTCRANLLISWPISIYTKTNYSWGWWKCYVPEQKTKAMQRKVSQWKGRIEWMNAEIQCSVSSEGLCTHKTVSIQTNHSFCIGRTLFCWERSQYENRTQSETFLFLTHNDSAVMSGSYNSSFCFKMQIFLTLHFWWMW